jgi:hypothetical protein
MTIDSKIRSLTRKQVKVLYWKCQGEKYIVIGIRHKRGKKWVQGLMTKAYRELGVPERSTAEEALEFLKVKKVCETLQELIPSPEELENWPLYGEKAVEISKGVYTYEPKTEDDPEEDPDPEISESVISETEAEEKQNPEVDAKKEKEADLEEQLRRKEEEERLKVEAEQRKINEEADRKRREENETLKEEVARLRKAEEERLQKEKQKEEVNQGRSRTAFPIRNSRLALVLGFLLFGVCAAGVVFIWREVSNIFSPASTPTSEVTSTQSLTTPQPTRTSENSPTPELSLTANVTFTPGIPPTAVPLPIIENFIEPISDVWQTTGDPYTASAITDTTYNGVLVSQKDTYATLQVGNTAWTDYVIHIKSRPLQGEMILGFRVKDPNNMLAIHCFNYTCNWEVYKDGILEVLRPADGSFEDLTLSIKGNNFTGKTRIGIGIQDEETFITLPGQYQGQFDSGGVYIKFKNMEIDLIEIQSLK